MRGCRCNFFGNFRLSQFLQVAERSKSSILALLATSGSRLCAPGTKIERQEKGITIKNPEWIQTKMGRSRIGGGREGGESVSGRGAGGRGGGEVGEVGEEGEAR